MRRFILLLAIFAATYAVPTGEPSSTGLCTPGETTKRDCNECICAADGSGLQCTDRVCDQANPPKVEDSAKVCEPGTSKKVDCNTCHCSSDGLNYLCTLMACPSHIQQKREVVEQEEKECTPGHTKQVDCNTCFCTDTGRYACTLKGCISSFSPLHSRLRREAGEVETCVPNSTKKLDCNNCFCTPNGLWACTLALCPGSRTRRDVEQTVPETNKEVTTDSLASTPCTAGEQINVDCNTCKCAADGTGYACTRQACPVEVHDRKRRSEDLAHTPCTPGEIKQEKCNECQCVKDGSGFFCTRQQCDDDEEQETTDAPQKCSPGETKTLDCNTCTCANDGSDFICTRKFCPVQQDAAERRRRQAPQNLPSNVPVNAPGFRCAPDSTFNDDCNTCRCNAEGNLASCTLKLCPK